MSLNEEDIEIIRMLISSCSINVNDYETKYTRCKMCCHKKDCQKLVNKLQKQLGEYYYNIINIAPKYVMNPIQQR